MPEALHERRRQRPFRILYMPFETFLRRFILRGEEAPASEARAPQAAEPQALAPQTTASQVPTSSGEKSIPWKCGVARLDDQNEALFKAIRQYQAALKSGVGSSATEEAMRFLEDHVEGHLPLEEAYLERIQFPGLEEHRQGHRAFQHQIHAFRHRVSVGDHSAGLELSQLLYAWMRVHVLKEDVVWSDYAKSRRRPKSTEEVKP